MLNRSNNKQFWLKPKFTEKWLLHRANAVSFEGCVALREPFSGLEQAIHSWKNLVKYNTINRHELKTLQIAGKTITYLS